MTLHDVGRASESLGLLEGQTTDASEEIFWKENPRCRRDVPSVEQQIRGGALVLVFGNWTCNLQLSFPAWQSVDAPGPVE